MQRAEVFLGADERVCGCTPVEEGTYSSVSVYPGGFTVSQIIKKKLMERHTIGSVQERRSVFRAYKFIML